LVDINEATTEWRYFYKELLPIIWYKVDSTLYDDGFYIQRINDLGQHDPEKYYYIWKISLPVD